MIWLCLSLTIGVFIFVLSPFWIGKSDLMEESSILSDPQMILARKIQLLERYKKEEAAFKKGDLTSFEWKRRKQFLESRYIDLSKRLDSISND